MTNSNIVALSTVKDLLISRAPDIEAQPVQHMSSGDIKQLRRRIQATTYGKLAVISDFEKFKANLSASLKLFFLWKPGASRCLGGHLLAPVDGKEYKPECGRCGEIISSVEQLKAS